MLPNLRPFRRAARFDGVFPIRSDREDITPAEVDRVARYVETHRTGDGGFDVVVGGPVDGDVSAMEEAGATWYLVGPNRRGESIEETLAWVSAGPPSAGQGAGRGWPAAKAPSTSEAAGSDRTR
jgi:hypothetical protein